MLTAKQVEHMPPGKQRYEVPVGDPRGLYLVVQRSGTKSWAIRYVYGGRHRKHTLGPWPETTLAAARAKAEAKFKLLDKGIDPALEEPDTSETIKTVVAEFIERYAKPRLRTWREIERMLEKELVQRYGERSIESVRRVDYLRIFDEMTDRGSPVAANRCHAYASRLLGWCVERGLLEHSPLDHVRPPNREQSRDRVLSMDELREIWEAAGRVAYPWGPMTRLLILTAQRRGEVAAMSWDDVDLDKRLWTLPASKTKAERIHDVPLSDPAVEILQTIPRFTGPYLWTTGDGTVSVKDYSGGKNRLDRAILAQRRKRDPKAGPPEPWRVHDIRRTVATHPAASGIAPHVLASFLNHSPGRTLGITAVYVRHRWLEERRPGFGNLGRPVAGGCRAETGGSTLGALIGSLETVRPPRA